MRITMLKAAFITFIAFLLLTGCSEKDTPSVPSTHAETAQQESFPVAEEELVGDPIPIPVKQPDEFNAYVPHKRSPKEIIVDCAYMDQSPTIDGIADEAFWGDIAPIETLDFSSQRPIELRCFHDADSIYFLISYPDGAPSESHKSWLWDKQEQVYKPCNDREDMFVFKWLMTGDSISFDHDKLSPHTADIWFWKARRTNPSGYFDDKSHIVNERNSLEAIELKSDKYGMLYLTRPGDDGKSAYEERMFFEYQGECLRKYYPRTPQGSRADIAGKGTWKDGRWTIECRRKLRTGHQDDIQFETGNQYLFSACLYEMSASAVEDYWYQPLYKSGNAFDQLILNMK